MEESVNVLEADLENVYQYIRGKIITLNVKWNDYLKLFRSDIKTIEILNRSGQTLFGHLQISLFEEIILQISRLLDPKETSVKGNMETNLSFDFFKEILINHYGSCLLNQKKINEKYEKMKNEYEPFKLWRDKRIAHDDLKYALKIEQLNDLNYETCKLMIKLINDFMNDCDKLLFDLPTAYDCSFSDGDASLLLSRLKFSMEYDKYNTIIKHCKMVNIIDVIPIEELRNLTIHEVLERINGN